MQGSIPSEKISLSRSFHEKAAEARSLVRKSDPKRQKRNDYSQARKLKEGTRVYNF